MLQIFCPHSQAEYAYGWTVEIDIYSPQKLRLPFSVTPAILFCMWLLYRIPNGSMHSVQWWTRGFLGKYQCIPCYQRTSSTDQNVYPNCWEKNWMHTKFFFTSCPFSEYSFTDTCVWKLFIWNIFLQHSKTDMRSCDKRIYYFHHNILFSVLLLIWLTRKINLLWQWKIFHIALLTSLNFGILVLNYIHLRHIDTRPSRSGSQSNTTSDNGVDGTIGQATQGIHASPGRAAYFDVDRVCKFLLGWCRFFHDWNSAAYWWSNIALFTIVHDPFSVQLRFHRMNFNGNPAAIPYVRHMSRGLCSKA